MISLKPMLLTAAKELPVGAGWVYEPKLDGFRCFLGQRVLSRSLKDLGACFPELVELGRALPEGAVLDGEIVAAGPDGVSFEVLQARLTLDRAGTKRAAALSPVALAAFDVLAVGGVDLQSRPLEERRSELAHLVERMADPRLVLIPQTDDPDLAQEWLKDWPAASGVEGVVCKRRTGPYRAGRRGWVKVKRRHSAEFVVRGVAGSPAAPRLVLGSRIHGRMRTVGFTQPIATVPEPLLKLMPLAGEARRFHSRWEEQRQLGHWIPLPETLVVEVTYHHLDAGILRQPANLLRWRLDREADEIGAPEMGVPESALE